MVTSNLPFGRWGEVFADDVVAAVMIDRLVHHAEVLTLSGDSYRTRARHKLLAKDRSRGDDHPLEVRSSPPPQAWNSGGVLTIFSGRVGDHNDHAMAAAGPLGMRLAERWTSARQLRIGTPAPALNSDWRTELAAAQGQLAELAAATRTAGQSGTRWLTVIPRCAGALATLPVVAEQQPEVCMVWFDAHADLHLPTTTSSGYLGGMALSGPLGWWDSGFGAGVGQAVLAGTRDIDPAEQSLITEHDIDVVAPGPNFAERLAEVVAQRQCYVHLDCDVLDPDIVPTDYRVPHGLGLADLHAAMRALSGLDLAGVEIAELQTHPDGTTADLDPLLTALSPVIDWAVAS